MFFSCRQDKSYFPNTDRHTSLFVEQQADSIWSDIENKDRWIFLTEMAGIAYENNAEADAWLTTHIEKLMPEQEALPESVYGLLRELAESSYPGASNTIARLILNAPEAKFYYPCLAQAAEIICRRFNFMKEKDSLSNYTMLMEAGLPYDPRAELYSSYYVYKSVVAELHGKLFEAVVLLHKGIDIADSKDSITLSRLYLSLATLYVDIDYIEKASLYIEKAVDLIGLQRFEPNMLNTYGVVARKNNDLDKAEEAYQLAIAYAEKNNAIGLQAQYFSNYANLKRNQKKFDEALYYMYRSDSICTELGIEVGWFINHVNRAEVYFDRGEYALANAELKKAEPLSMKFNNPKISREFYKTRYRVFDALGDEVSANKAHRLYVHYKESFTGDLPRSIIAEWELATESEKSLARAAALQVSIQSLKKDKYLAALIFTIIILGLSFLFFFKYRKSLLEREQIKQEKQKMAFELELKSKELLADSIKDITVQNAKHQVYNELSSILKTLPHSHKAKFYALESRLKAESEHPFLKEFEQRFNGVHESFYDKIRTIAPDLTPNELRICAMLRLNLSTKEIAELTGRSTGTIDNKRSSIRKKLNLNDQDGLLQFLMDV